MGGCDVVLGVEWLQYLGLVNMDFKYLGLVNMDFKYLYVSFTKEG
jgi:hypothetical protein